MVGVLNRCACCADFATDDSRIFYSRRRQVFEVYRKGVVMAVKRRVVANAALCRSDMADDLGAVPDDSAGCEAAQRGEIQCARS